MITWANTVTPLSWQQQQRLKGKGNNPHFHRLGNSLRDWTIISGILISLPLHMNIVSYFKCFKKCYILRSHFCDIFFNKWFWWKLHFTFSNGKEWETRMKYVVLMTTKRSVWKNAIFNLLTPSSIVLALSWFLIFYISFTMLALRKKNYDERLTHGL